jgi:hypothetical protein
VAVGDCRREPAGETTGQLGTGHIEPVVRLGTLPVRNNNAPTNWTPTAATPAQTSASSLTTEMDDQPMTQREVVESATVVVTMVVDDQNKRLDVFAADLAAKVNALLADSTRGLEPGHANGSQSLTRAGAGNLLSIEEFAHVSRQR